jgi:protein SCO1/2
MSVTRGPLLALLLAGLLPAATAWPDVAPPSATAPPINSRYLLLDARGRMISNEDFPGRYQLITFGYTSCPDVCPTTLANMAQVRRRLGPLGERLQLIFITLDPERDDAPALARYTAYFDAQIIGLTGSVELIRAAAEHFQVQFRKFASPGGATGRYSLDHTTGMYLLGPDGLFLARFAYDTAAPDIATRVTALMGADANQ